jgi:hypothetical protein
MISQINTTFAFMKKRRNIFFYILLLLSVFSYSGIDVNNNSDTPTSCQQLSLINNDNENSLRSDMDTSEEDQMDHSYISGLTEQLKGQQSHPCILPRFADLFLSVWQPPKAF